MKVKCCVCGNMHYLDYCSVVNPNSNKWKDSIITKAKLNQKKGVKTYICDLCQS